MVSGRPDCGPSAGCQLKDSFLFKELAMKIEKAYFISFGQGLYIDITQAEKDTESGIIGGVDISMCDCKEAVFLTPAEIRQLVSFLTELVEQ
jgi:hypothetical protein